jgi:hypothetical protein
MFIDPKKELLADGGRPPEAKDQIGRLWLAQAVSRRSSHSSQYIDLAMICRQPRGQLQKPGLPSRTRISTHTQRAWMVGRLLARERIISASLWSIHPLGPCGLTACDGCATQLPDQPRMVLVAE